MKLVDIHSHVLPYIDDGAEDWKTALQMMRQAEKDGIDCVVCTPHILSEKDFKHEAEILQRFEELRQKVRKAGISVNLELGCEIYAQPYIPFEQKIATLAGNGRYFLIEFPLNMVQDLLFKQFFNTVRQNTTPIIAHPERYAYLQSKPAGAYEFVKNGALLQLNAGSLMGVFGHAARALSFRLIEADLIHVVGSDAHDLDTRPLKLSDSYHLVSERWGKDKADQLFCINPSRILAGEHIFLAPPKPMHREQKNAKNVFTKMIKTLKRP